MPISIPEELSTRLRQLAARRGRPVEEILTDRLLTALDEELDNLPAAEAAELRALHHLSEDALRAIAAEQMSAENQARLAQLLEGQAQGTLTRVEQETLAALVERGDQLMLRKAEAAAILVHRGYSGSAAELMRGSG